MPMEEIWSTKINNVVPVRHLTISSQLTPNSLVQLSCGKIWRRSQVPGRWRSALFGPAGDWALGAWSYSLIRWAPLLSQRELIGSHRKLIGIGLAGLVC